VPAGVQDFLKQLSQFWAGLGNVKRTALVLATTAVLALVWLVPVLANRPNFVPLYPAMSAEDAAKVVEKLDAASIPYELAAGGTIVLVPGDRRDRLRLEMAAEGLPRSNAVGFELFDKSQFGATEFEQHVNLRRALEGELARSIATVDGVGSARVHLVLPRQSVFISKKEEPSASVVVKLKNPALFGKQEVAAVVHLVSAAVPGLNRNRVSVVSTEGHTLHRPTSGTGLSDIDSDSFVEESQAIAGSLEAQALAQLERVVGPGGADVRVAATLDTSTREETQETYQPDKTALRSEHTSSEEIKNQTAGAEGIPGSRSNLPDNTGNAATQTNVAQNTETTSRNSSTRNWEVDRAVAKVHTPPGKVARLSVAVLLDGTWKATKDGKEAFEPRSEQEVKDLTEIVKQAVGFDPLRGDAITVTAAKFARPEPLGESAVPKLWYEAPWVMLAALGLLALIVLLSVVLVWRKSTKAKRLAEQARLAMQNDLARTRERILGETENQRQLSGEAFDIKRITGSGPEAIAEIRQKALEMAAADPASTAVVLRSWLEQTDATRAAEAAE
jgi:flagellar M-ring protein FliF